MPRAILAVIVAAAVVAWSPAGHAQAFSDHGNVTLSIERAFGLHWEGTDYAHRGPGHDDNDKVVFGFGWYRSETAYNNPRAGVDVFVIDHLSIGGTLGIYGWGGDADQVGMILSPRVGYGAMLGKSVGIWPRGGVTFFSEGDGAHFWQFALSAECPFAFFPQSSWAILLGPTMDLGLVGKHGDTGVHQHSVGLAVGIMGVL